MKSSVGPLVRAFSFFMNLWPRGLYKLVGAFIALLWFDIFRFRRQIVLSNLAIAFPEKSRAWRVRTGRRSLFHLGAAFVEFFTLPQLNEKWLKKHVVYEGMEHLQKARDAGKGALVLTLHMGPTDIAASLLPMGGFPSYLISKHFKTKWFNDLWFSIRGAQGMRFIEPHGEKTPFEILKGLKSNSLVIFVLDQYMGRPFGIATSFFGKRTGTAYGLALFALKTKAPVVPVYSFEDESGKIHLRALEALNLEPYRELERDQALQEMTQLFNNVLEGIVRQHPEQWMWVHRRWKEFG